METQRPFGCSEPPQVASDDLDTAEKATKIAGNAPKWSERKALSLFSRLSTLRPELFRGLGKDLRDAARCEGRRAFRADESRKIHVLHLVLPCVHPFQQPFESFFGTYLV